jgi:AraC-like DNA-binding protein
VLIRAGVEYRITPRPRVSVIVVNFDITSDFSSIRQSFHPYSSDFPGVLENVSLDDAPALDTALILSDGGRFTSRIRSMLNDFHDVPEWRDAFLSATAKALILDLVRSDMETSRGANGPSRLVREVTAYLREHYADRVENETMAKHFHFTSVYLNRLLKKETGLSLRQYLIALRIDVAKELLSSGEYSPYEVATAVGFEDYPHFSKTFKRATGKSPSEYRIAEKVLP